MTNGSSEYKFIINKGKIITSFMENNEIFVCNGRAQSDFPAQFTLFHGATGQSVNDLLWCSINSIYAGP